MWEFIQGYGIWILLAIVAFLLFAGGCGRGNSMGCGGHSSHRPRRGDRLHTHRGQEDGRDEATVGALAVEPRSDS